MDKESLENNHINSNMQKVALTALAGTSIEWYDFFLYGAAAALIFPAAFFGEVPPTTALILSLLTIIFLSISLFVFFHKRVPGAQQRLQKPWGKPNQSIHHCCFVKNVSEQFGRHCHRIVRCWFQCTDKCIWRRRCWYFGGHRFFS